MKTAAVEAQSTAACSVCGRGNDEHQGKACWAFGADAHESAHLFKKRVQAQRPGVKPSWELIETAFRQGFAMVNGAWIEHDGKGIQQTGGRGPSRKARLTRAR